MELSLASSDQINKGSGYTWWQHVKLVVVVVVVMCVLVCGRGMVFGQSLGNRARAGLTLAAAKTWCGSCCAFLKGTYLLICLPEKHQGRSAPAWLHLHM